jgi:predicted patatin/cPLA2 family phospholipase
VVRVLRRLVLLLPFAFAAGCWGRLGDQPTPIQAGYNPVELLEPVGERDADNQLDLNDLYSVAEQWRQARRPAVLPPERNVLCLSGGGSYGAFSAGVLYGWTQTGTRPTFDVVTGVSTGALIAPLAFIGCEYDEPLKQVYTTLRNKDIFRIRKTVRLLFLATESLADNTPLAGVIEEYITPEVLRKVAAAHAAGRRLYVCTTELESRRPVYWDMGEIAARGTPEAVELFHNILLASSAIPGFFPPVRIPVTVDGRPLEELHTDGSVSNALFFRPPHVDKECRANPDKTCLYGSNVYAVIAGKVYADPDRVPLRALPIASTSASALIYAETRGDLLKLYTACLLTGMDYHIAAIPTDVPVPFASTDFKPENMTSLFEQGRAWATTGPGWRTTPPGLEPGEGAFLRAGTALTRVPLQTPPAVNTPAPRRPGRQMAK